MRKNKSIIRMKMEGYEAVEKVAQAGGNSARIYVLKHWEGKRIKAILIQR